METQTITVNNNNWAFFTYYPKTGYISHGPFNFTQEQAYSILKCQLLLDEHKTKRDHMWIQQESKEEKIYYCKQYE